MYFLCHTSKSLYYFVLGNLDGYKNISTKLKIGPFEEDGLLRMPSAERQLQQSSDEPESPGSGKPCMLFCIGLFTAVCSWKS
jgi:hypothetical protein